MCTNKIEMVQLFMKKVILLNGHDMKSFQTGLIPIGNYM